MTKQEQIDRDAIHRELFNIKHDFARLLLVLGYEKTFYPNEAIQKIPKVPWYLRRIVISVK